MSYPESLRALFDDALAERVLASGDVAPMNAVAPGFWLGSQRAAGVAFPYERGAAADALRAEALAALRAAGITHIVCCCGEGPGWRVFDGQLAYLNASLDDGDAAAVEAGAPAFSALLARALPWVAAARAAGGGVLVHCASGAHRSASVLAGLLMAERRAPLAAVLPAILAARPFARPTFWRALEAAAPALGAAPAPQGAAEAAAAPRQVD